MTLSNIDNPPTSAEFFMYQLLYRVTQPGDHLSLQRYIVFCHVMFFVLVHTPHMRRLVQNVALHVFILASHSNIIE
jgi:hypothetical protein